MNSLGRVRWQALEVNTGTEHLGKGKASWKGDGLMAERGVRKP